MSVRRWLDNLVFFGIVGAIATCSYLVGTPDPEDLVQPGTPEYEAYIAAEVAICYESTLRRDLDKSRAELPVMPTRAERMGMCRDIAVEYYGLFPRPRKEDWD